MLGYACPEGVQLGTCEAAGGAGEVVAGCGSAVMKAGAGSAWWPLLLGAEVSFC